MARPPLIAIDNIAAALPDFDVEREDMLRQLGERDPLPGTPMMVEFHPGAEPEPIEAGAWSSTGYVDRRTGLPRNCPVTPLGKSGEVCWFLDTLGGVATLEAKSSGKGPIGYMFGGRSRWLEWAWPRFGRGGKGSKAPVNGWDADDARQALVDACAYKGFFALEDQVRGRGAWRDDDGSLIYHAGDRVWLGGAWVACGAHGRFIYPARKAIGEPAGRAQPAGLGSPGDVLLEVLRTFNWERGEFDARLMLGWLMTAKVGGALERRPVAFVTGAEGSGKSTLHGLLRIVMNHALIKTSNTTQAGIYQRLEQDSIAIMVDEMEAKDDTRTVDKILELARICYSGDTMQRGGKDGVGREFTLTSSFMGCSIAKPATDAQDDSRMVVLMLREREIAGGQVPTTAKELEVIGRQLLRRWFDGWARWPALLKVFRDALIAMGHNDRACDTFAPLAAAAHLAISDDMPGASELEQWAFWLAPDDLAETANRQKTWRRCLSYLLAATPETFRTRHFKSVGQVLEAFKERVEALGDLGDYLPAVGLSFSWADDQPIHTYATGRLFVPTSSPPLQALFEGTPWAGRRGAPGPWNGVLRQAPPHLWKNGKCDKGLDRKTAGIFIDLAKAMEVV